MSRKYNFCAGPSAFPEEVLLELKEEILDWKNHGLSVMEMSHRSKEFVAIAAEAKQDLIDLLKINKYYERIYQYKLKSYKKVLIEQFIAGREIQAAIMGDKKLGAIELKPKRKFYDYQAKYNSNAKTEHIIPVDLPKKKYKDLMDITFKAHNLMGCRGVTRSDFKYFKGKFYLLEINTQPGMTKLSLVPEISAYIGINFINLIKLILKDASINK